MKTKILALAAAAAMLTGIAHAATPGAYVGGSLGLGRIHTPDKYAFVATSNKRDLGGLGFDLNGGYNFNQYWGVEAGFMRPGESEYTGRMVGGARSKITYNANVFDLVGKGYLPFANNKANVFAKAGLAYVSQDVDFKAGSASVNNTRFRTPKTGDHSYHAIRPVIGVGVSYSLTKELSANMSLTHVQGKGNIKRDRDAIEDINYLGFGLSYSFQGLL